VHALASHPALSRNDYALAASDVPSLRLDEAISELLSRRVLSGDGRAYSLSRREWSEALLTPLTDDARRDRHRRLAELYAKDAALALERADQLLAAGDDADGLDVLVTVLSRVAAEGQGLLSATKMGADRVASILDRALTCAERLERKPRDLYELRRALVAISIVSDEARYLRVARDWLGQLEHDSGLALYASIVDAADPGDRLRRALTGAAARHAATPEHERVCGPEEAIKAVAYYVAVSIALGSRMQDAALIASLPALLEPFAALSPLLHAIWQNSIATREVLCDNQPELGRARWLEVLQALSKVSSAELSYVANLRNAVVYGIALIESRLGFVSAEQTVRALDDDPLQVVSAMSLRKIARLHQGDFAGAERFRRRAEQLALHTNLRSMFSSTLQAELVAYALASDLTGIKQIAERIEPLAARFGGWLGYKHLADGYFEQARGQHEAALAALERGLAVSDPAPRVTGRSCGAWPRLEGARIETLVSLGRADEARSLGERALATCAEHRIDAAAFVIRRALALAEAKLGDYAHASRRLEAVIAELIALGVTGLELGATYEARARIAVWFSDDDAVAAFARHTAKEYRYGQGSSLGARYERLVDEARGADLSALPQLFEFQTKLATSQAGGALVSGTAPALRSGALSASAIDDKLAGADTAADRAARVLRLLCEGRVGRSAHLYLQTERGLEHAASLGTSARDPALDDFVRRFAAAQRTAADCATVAESSGGPSLTSACWVDAKGVAHHPQLLTAEIDGVERPVGAVVIEASDGTAVTLTSHLLDAVGDYLVRAGDASRVRRSDSS
jgi:tetratricopeptide (TPR) repeat protein